MTTERTRLSPETIAAANGVIAGMVDIPRGNVTIEPGTRRYEAPEGLIVEGSTRFWGNVTVEPPRVRLDHTAREAAWQLTNGDQVLIVVPSANDVAYMLHNVAATAHEIADWPAIVRHVAMNPDVIMYDRDGEPFGGRVLVRTVDSVRAGMSSGHLDYIHLPHGEDLERLPCWANVRKGLTVAKDLAR
ncbi:hypothetical protein C5E10_06295 [Pseudoclavibacter sp. RFBG4]|uniref:hypothetical protein n=1 Tax=Pseudoclavibacter sp. RFBG4 TaxID=2080575 RepID=UPI000CE73B3D|nr:hypothetical protein [Pseudoclavibacter sp. RFBG4]PPG35198.1 hypothetical protein C5E10_06295 [Pseudoclavibacter sp. RFBG4]